MFRIPGLSYIDFKCEHRIYTNSLECLSLGSMKTISTLSLFTGGGGLDIGFAKAGFKILACVDIDETACEILELNKGKYFEDSSKIINDDIRNIKPERLGLRRVDFIIGGPPCQSFSAAGRRAGGSLGVADLRGSLFWHYCKYIRHYQPRGFLFENVRGILYSNKREDWNLILSSFSDLGYKISYRVLDCADYGVPQHRERVILIGCQDKEILFPQPTHGPDAPLKRTYVSALEAMEDLQPLSEPEHVYGGKYGKLLSEIPPGMNYLYFTRETGYPNPIFAWRSRFSHFLYKADPSGPVKTIVARQSKFCGPFHWKNRRFTIKELKRLQTFPDDYEVGSSYQKALSQIGNSVPPKFAAQLALAVLEQMFDVDTGISLLPKEVVLSFDKRKAKKARKTRKLRLRILDERKKRRVERKFIDRTEVKFFEYVSPNERFENDGLGRHDSSSLFKWVLERVGKKCQITVNKFSRNKLLSTPIIKYHLTFHHLIGNGFSEIECELVSDDSSDIIVAWDAIEHFVCGNSNYLSLMDTFGHFTEPHPIFTLECKVYGNDPKPFLLNFAKYFSNFSRISKVYPASVLRKLWSISNEKEKFNFLEIVKGLRDLRFDIRVYETNKTIRPGMFKVCYPFTLQYKKPVSVTWDDSKGGNSNL